MLNKTYRSEFTNARAYLNISVNNNTQEAPENDFNAIHSTANIIID